MVPIDVGAPGSDEWWLSQLTAKLERRRERLEMLDERFRGDPPLPEGAENMREAYLAFQRKARTNFAELIVEACRERMRVAGFRTAAAGDDNGDTAARALWQANNMDVTSADVHATMLSLGDAYVIVGKDEDGQPLITGEDPRQVVTVHDPQRQHVVLAGLKMFADNVAGKAFAYLYLRGEKGGPARVRVSTSEYTPSPFLPPTARFNPTSWAWDDSLGGPLPFTQAPIVRFRNRRGVGEFETHIDLLDRINHQILQRMVIATMQAFRQRVIEGGAGLQDADGNDIDWSILVADPGALWTLPEGTKVWESGQVDLTPILSAVKDDLQTLSAVTRTPFHMLSPDGANQSAEGASLSREGLVFKAEDRIARATPGWQDVMSLGFLVAGDRARGDRAKIEVVWGDPQRRSLAELADAAVKKQAAGVPWRQLMIDLGYTLPEIDRMEQDRLTDATLPARAAAEVGVEVSAEAEQADIRSKNAATYGTLFRGGVKQRSAASAAGLEGLEFEELLPITLRAEDGSQGQPPQFANAPAGPSADGDEGDEQS